MPKEQPLQRLAPLQLILKPKHIILIRKLQQIQKLGRRLHDWKRRRLGMVDEDGDAAVGVEAEKPVFLLLVAHDVAAKGGQRSVEYVHKRRKAFGSRERVTNVQEAMCPLGAIDLVQFLEHNLHLLPIGRAHRDEVKTLHINTISPNHRDQADPIKVTYLCILHLIRRLGFKKMRHVGRRSW